MKASSACFDLIKRFESFRADAYKCPAGVWTVGYGHTRDAHPGMTVSEPFACQLLAEDIEGVEQELALAVHVPVTQGQWDALVSFAFNVGTWALLKSTLLGKLNAGERLAASDEFLRWNHGGGKVLAGLTRRRDAERELFLS